MKTEKEIQDKLEGLDADRATKFFNMTYEQGVEEALIWVLEEIDDEEFGI